MREVISVTRQLLALMVAVAVFMGLPSAAFAHAELLGTEPSHEAIVSQHPEKIMLAFSEHVTAPFGAVKVYDPDGERVESGSARAIGKVVTVEMKSKKSGTYAVSWRVASADGHPIRGAFVFHVEEKSSDTVSRDAALKASAGSRSKDIAFGLARLGTLLGVLIAAGGVFFSVLGGGAWRPKWLRVSLVLALISMLAAFVLDASIAAGLSLGDTLSVDVLKEQATTVYGRATLIRLGVLAACVVTVLFVKPARWSKPALGGLVAVLFMFLAATMSMSGHAVGDDVTILRLPLDMMHSIAAAAWIGGLVQLVFWSRTSRVSAQVLDRWSRIAVGAVVMLVVTGAWAAWEEVGLSIQGFTSTTYGRLVLVKIALLVAAMPLANLNRRRIVPAIKRDVENSRSSLRRYVLAEIALLAFVLMATAWLVQTPPAKVQLAPKFVAKTIPLESGGSAQLVIDPATAGTNEIHVYIFDKQQQVDASVTDVTLTATNKQRGLGPLDFDLLPAGPAHFTNASSTIPFAGKWSFDAALTRGRFDEESVSFSVKIAPAR